jgi:hypothetical protein
LSGLKPGPISEAKAETSAKADPYGMTNKRATAKAETSAKADPYGMTNKRATAEADPYGMTNKEQKQKLEADPPLREG